MQSRRLRSGRTVIAVTVYLVGFLLLILLLTRYYLIPAMAARQHADLRTQRVMSAYALLIMSLVLFILFLGLMFTFRVGRFFRPRPTSSAKPTKYVDAWQESGRRLEVPDEEEAADEDEMLG